MDQRTAGLFDRARLDTVNVPLYTGVAGVAHLVFSGSHVILHLRGVC